MKSKGYSPGASTQNVRASELLLAFARLARSSRHREMPEELREVLSCGALAPRHFGAFVVIAMEGSMTVSELAKREGIALSTASLLVTQLFDAGLVERHEDLADRRRTLVSIEPKYREQSESLLAARLAPLHRALERMGPTRSCALMEALAIVAEEIDFDNDDLGESTDHIEGGKA